MAEDSMLWTTNGTGDGPGGGYTQANWDDYHRYIFSPDVEATQFVLPRKGNKLNPTAGASSVNVDTGAAFVYGFFYKNTASVNVPITTPTLGTTGLRVVLRATWATQLVRAAVVRNSDGVSGIPAATQTPGTTYEVTLATGTITTGGVVTLTDARGYLKPAFGPDASWYDNSTIELATGDIVRAKDNGITNAKIRDSGALSVIGRSANSTGDPADIAAVAASGAVLRESGSTIGFGQVATAGIADDAVDDTKVGNRVPQMYRRQGNSATDWDTVGTTTQTPALVRMQAGAVNSSTAGAIAITYPVAFTNKPLLFAVAAPGSATPYFCVIGPVTNTGATLAVMDQAGNGVVGVPIHWLAIGTQ